MKTCTLIMVNVIATDYEIYGGVKFRAASILAISRVVVPTYFVILD
jgi:hypothetical protein